MANCCGGKNAGKRIGWGRYAAGLTVFVGYHGAMRALLTAASVPIPALAKVRDFHKQCFETDLREILAFEDINLNGRLDSTPCDIPYELDDIATVSVDEEPITTIPLGNVDDDLVTAVAS
jgi:hypothetical protein